MKAMLLPKVIDLNQIRQDDIDGPLTFAEIPRPTPKENEVLLKVLTCAVCHTELDEIEGRTPPPHFPVIPGHQVIGEVVRKPATAKGINLGDRVGVAWIYSAL